MFLKRYFRNVSVYFLVALLLFAGAILLFSYVMHEVLFEHEVAVDNNILDFFSRHIISSSRTRIMVVVTYFASAQFMQIGYAVLASKGMLL